MVAIRRNVFKSRRPQSQCEEGKAENGVKVEALLKVIPSVKADLEQTPALIGDRDQNPRDDVNNITPLNSKC
jgi:hypothetical protein